MTEQEKYGLGLGAFVVVLTIAGALTSYGFVKMAGNEWTSIAFVVLASAMNSRFWYKMANKTFIDLQDDIKR